MVNEPHDVLEDEELVVDESANAELADSNDIAAEGKHVNSELGDAVDTAENPAEEKGGAELEGLRQQLLRVHADFDNFRKRTRQEKEDLRLFAIKKLIGELLPVADNFERAMSSFENASGVEEVKAGLDMVHRQLLQIFQQNGVEVLNPQNEAFDPNVHEAVMQEAAEGRETGIITEVLQKGYSLHSKVLRPAMVKVTV